MVATRRPPRTTTNVSPRSASSSTAAKFRAARYSLLRRWMTCPRNRATCSPAVVATAMS